MTARRQHEEPRKSPHYYTKEELAFVKERYGTKKAKEIAKEFNEHFNSDINHDQIYRLNRTYQWVPIKESYVRKRLFSDEHLEYVKQIYKGQPRRKTAEMLNEKFGTSFTTEQVGGLMDRNSLANGLDTRFKEGTISFNKGSKWDDYLTKEQQERIKKTCFGYGQKMPEEHWHIGDICIKYKNQSKKNKTNKAYNYIKVAPNTWRPYAQYVWEQANGRKLKKTEKIFRIDGDTLNDNLDNLLVVTDNDLVRINWYEGKYGKIKNRDLREVQMLILKLRNMTVKKEKEKCNAKIALT